MRLKLELFNGNKRIGFFKEFKTDEPGFWTTRNTELAMIFTDYAVYEKACLRAYTLGWYTHDVPQEGDVNF